MPNAVYPIAFASAMVAQLIVLSLLLMRIKKHHQGVWVRLGRPVHWWSGDQELPRFIWSGAHRQMGDPLLKVWVLASRTCQAVMVLVFGLAVALTILEAWLG
jgi:hypothetical protein